MKFNRFVWELYKNSQQGQKALERCSRFSDAKTDGTFLLPLFGMSFDWDFEKGPQDRTTDEGIASSSAWAAYCRLWLASHQDRTTDEGIARDIEDIQKHASTFSVNSLEEAFAAYEEMVRRGLPLSDLDRPGEVVMLEPADIADFIGLISLGLHLTHPEYFLPYGFRTGFAFLQRLCELFSIPLPPIPGKRNKVGRALYYAQINQSFHEFRHLHNLDSVEMCAFLYDFASRFVQEDYDELPPPTKVWPLIGGAYNATDFEWLEAAKEDSTSPWNGHKEIRRGDILLMYYVTPHKRVHSIWRATTDGFVDPFIHYHSIVWIGHPIKTVPVNFQEMRGHPLLSQNSAVKTHMRGPDSGPFTLKEYEALLEIMASKGQDISLLPRPQTIDFLPSTELDNERDVEVHLIEPLLERLGYGPADWLRQMPIRMGRGERNYPDYVFGANQTRGEETATMVLESKFRISGERDLQEAYFQAKSYALRLQARVMVLAAREGVWVFPYHRGSFTLERASHWNWNDLSHPDSFHRLAADIGKGQFAR